VDRNEILRFVSGQRFFNSHREQTEESSSTSIDELPRSCGVSEPSDEGLPEAVTPIVFVGIRSGLVWIADGSIGNDGL
jgi:hypothetical protein